MIEANKALKALLASSMAMRVADERHCTEPLECLQSANEASLSRATSLWPDVPRGSVAGHRTGPSEAELERSACPSVAPQEEIAVALGALIATTAQQQPAGRPRRSAPGA